MSRPGQRHRDLDDAALGVAGTLDGHLVGRHHVPGLVLATLAVEPLVRRAAIEQTDAHQGQPERARGLELLGGHRAQSPREDRQRVGERELRREERDHLVLLVCGDASRTTSWCVWAK